MRRLVDPEPEFEPDPNDEVFDVLPHGGCWSRPAGEDELRCKEHDLTVAEH